MEKQEKLRVDNGQGWFKIVQFTDLHWTNGQEKDKKTFQGILHIIAKEKPDLLVITGDVIESLLCANPYHSYREVLSLISGTGIPWIAQFGNHDTEGKTDKRKLLEIQLGLPGCFSKHGPNKLPGLGNFCIPLMGRADHLMAALYFLDSGGYSEEVNLPGYAWIQPAQIAWFQEHAASLRQHNNGISMCSLVFQHIPLPEYRLVWNTTTCSGRKWEKVHAPQYNSGFFKELLRAGGVKGVFCGHDHLNDYMGTLEGIRLCYGRVTGYGTYAKWMLRAGARVILLKDDEPRFSTWIRLANGRKMIRPRWHLPHRFSRA